MSTKTTLRKPVFLLSLIIALIMTFGLEALAQTAKGKEVYADVWLDELVLFFSLCLCVVVISSQWKTASKGKKYLILAITGLSILLVISGTSQNWQYFPWSRASAFDTADEFMTDLQKQDFNRCF